MKVNITLLTTITWTGRRQPPITPPEPSEDCAFMEIEPLPS
jgi:hypothetical protein